MKLTTTSLRRTLNKAYLKEPVQRADIERFKANESGENAKMHLRDFLKDT